MKGSTEMKPLQCPTCESLQQARTEKIFAEFKAEESARTIRKAARKPARKMLKLDEPANQELAKSISAPANLASASPGTVSDQLLLDTVRDRVYQMLLDGEIKLGLADGFKAIEIKNKIAEESQNEKLLLEILNEIRAEELGGGQGKS